MTSTNTVDYLYNIQTAITVFHKATLFASRVYRYLPNCELSTKKAHEMAQQDVLKTFCYKNYNSTRFLSQFVFFRDFKYIETTSADF